MGQRGGASCAQTASSRTLKRSRHHAYATCDTMSLLHRGPKWGLAWTHYFRKVLYLWGTRMCVFLHLLSAFPTRKHSVHLPVAFYTWKFPQQEGWLGKLRELQH